MAHLPGLEEVSKIQIKFIAARCPSFGHPVCDKATAAKVLNESVHPKSEAKAADSNHSINQMALHNFPAPAAAYYARARNLRNPVVRVWWQGPYKCLRHPVSSSLLVMNAGLDCMLIWAEFQLMGLRQNDHYQNFLTRSTSSSFITHFWFG